MAKNVEWYGEGYFERDEMGGYNGYIREASDNLKRYFDDILGKLEQFGFEGPLKILDIGCAYGLLVDWLREEGHDSYGVDISEWAISQSKENCQVYDGMHLPFEDSSFDAITSLDCLEHVPADEATILLDEIKRVLKPNGLCYFAIGYGQEQDLTHVNIKSEWWQETFNTKKFILKDKGVMSGEVYVCGTSKE